MQRASYWTIVILVLLLVAPLTTLAQDNGDPETIAQAVVENLLAGDFAGAVENFDAVIQVALPPETLQQTWESLLAQVGPFQEQLATRSQPAGQYTVVIITLQFEKMSIDVQVSIDDAGQVGGLYFSQTPQEYQPPVYADTGAFTEQEVTVGGDDWALPGTLTLPTGDGPFPAVVLVHGSGPQDRNEALGPHRPFQDLAWGLATNGIAVLRYDKRTLVYGEKMAAQPDLTVQDETIDDALAAVDLLRTIDGIDPARVYVLGHSLGGYLAPRIAAQAPDIAGIIILAGNSRPLGNLILEQTTYLLGLDGDLSDDDQVQSDAIAQQVEAIQNLKPEDEAAALLLGAPPAYWLDLNAYDPVGTAQALAVPILILQGERDYQVTMTDFAGWQDGLATREDVTLITYPTLNHHFVSGQEPGSPAEYAVPGNVSQAVIEDIIAWIQAN
ncbi:MAG: alpha/beta fold hydrolase [Anaerolineae bacterium]|nr:alpha/beta fold hydrolase [Anaerolineae bacterium]